MTHTELREARLRLGLGTPGLGKALQLGPNGGRTVRRWEAEKHPIPGPAAVAVQLMLEKHTVCAKDHNGSDESGAS